MGNAILTGQSGGGNSIIKTIQRGIITVDSSTGQTNGEFILNINAVDLNSAIVRITGLTRINTTYSNDSQIMYTASLISPTQVKFKCLVDVLGTEIGWEVIEFNNVKSLQSGIATSATISINTVDSSKSIAFVSAIPNSAGTGLYRMGYPYCLYNNRIEIVEHFPKTYQWYVVEFK